MRKLILVLFFLSIPFQSFAITTTLQEGVSSYAGTTDTRLDADATTTNRDTASLGLPYAFSGHDQRNLIKFDLTPAVSGIPSNAVVSAASLAIRITSGLSGDDCATHVRRVLRAWGETTATYNTYDGSNGWGTAGAKNTSTDITASDDGSNTRTSISSPVTITVTGLETLVQGWISGTYTNNGMVVYSDVEGDASGVAGDSENATSSNRPLLSVTYTVPSATGANIYNAVIYKANIFN